MEPPPPKPKRNPRKTSSATTFQSEDMQQPSLPDTQTTKTERNKVPRYQAEARTKLSSSSRQSNPRSKRRRGFRRGNFWGSSPTNSPPVPDDESTKQTQQQLQQKRRISPRVLRLDLQLGQQKHQAPSDSQPHQHPPTRIKPLMCNPTSTLPKQQLRQAMASFQMNNPNVASPQARRPRRQKISRDRRRIVHR